MSANASVHVNTDKFMMFQMRKVDAPVIWLLFLFFGWSYGSLGKIGTQIAFYLTFGGFGIWWLIRLFTLQGAIDDYNHKVAKEVGLTPEEMYHLGVM